MKNPTLREIARACGVSASTVSRAFNNQRAIPAETRARILRQATQMGWKPNPLASAYMAHLRSTQPTRHQANLAFLVALEGAEKFADLPGYHKDVYRGARQRAEALGYSLDAVWLSGLGFSMKRLASVLKSRGVLGLIVHGGNTGAELFSGFDWNAFALATWGFSLDAPPMHRAAHDMASEMPVALARLRARGHCRIALVISEYQDHIQNHAALAYYLYEQERAELPPLNHIYKQEEGEEIPRLQRWLREVRPDAVIGDTSVFAALESLPQKIRRSIAFYSITWDQYFRQIPGIDHRPDRVGSNVLDLLVGQLNRNERGIPASPKLLLNEGEWREAAAKKHRAGGG